MIVIKSPEPNDQFPWSPIEVIQVNIADDVILNIDDKGRARRRPVGAVSRKLAENYAEGLKSNARYYEQVRNAPNLFTIAIGVWKKKHEGVDVVNTPSGKTWRGKDIDYVDLFEILQRGIRTKSGLKNYDPLKIIRENVETIEGDIELAALKIYNDGAAGMHINKQSFVSALEKIGNKWLNKVKDYIAGGEAPALGKATRSFWRPAKEIDGTTPLLATGDLLDAMKMKVWVEQTELFHKHASARADELKRSRVVFKERQRLIKVKEELSKKSSGFLESSIVNEVSRINNARKSIARNMRDTSAVSDVLESVMSDKPIKKTREEEIITKKFESGILKGIKLNIKRGSKTYKDILGYDAEGRKKIADAWSIFSSERQSATESMRKSGRGIEAYSEWQADFAKRFGQFPDRSTLELMEAAYKYLESNGGEIK